MPPGHSLTFGPFRLDVTQGQLWRGAQVLPLRRRSLAMLCYLAEHPGRLVTKAELRQHVWGGTHVTDTVLRVSVQEIRAALGDVADAPRYLATVGRQGYRFLAGDDREVVPPLLAGPLVGRQSEVDTLQSWFQHAAQGTRQLVLVGGDAGVGKTTVVEQWLARLAADGGVRIARGQCVEHFGEGEPYLPLLEALGYLARGPDHREVLDALRRYAPTWLVQCPGLLPEAELQRLQHQLQGATAARMLRELAGVLDVLTAETPLVLVLEDLHWSDRPTVECLNYLAQRRVPARLLVLGTYRPVDAAILGHPLRPIVQELCGRGYATELGLELLTSADVTAYLTGRLGGAVSARLTAVVYERTDGNALFMVNIVEHLVQQGFVVRREGQWTLPEGAEAKVSSLPEGLQQFLIRRLEALAPQDRRVLEAASVAGEQFTVAAVAPGAQSSVDEVEASCEGLAAQGRFLDDIGLREWPDGTSSGRYRFAHAVYRQVLYEGLGTVRRQQLHRRIGLRLEAGYGAQAEEIAARLAVHFERGGEIPRAVHHWQQAGDNAARRSAHHEAIAALQRALAWLATLPESPKLVRRELTLQLALGELLMAAKGLAAPEAREAFVRAHMLCPQVGETAKLVQVLWGLVLFHTVQAQLCTAEEFCQQFFRLTQTQDDPLLALEGHLALGLIELHREHIVVARDHLNQSLPLCDEQRSRAFRAGYELRVLHLACFALALWRSSSADQGEQRSQEALTLARGVEHVPSVAFAELCAAFLTQQRRDVAATQAHAESLIAIAAAQGYGVRLAQGRMLRGWALAIQGKTVEGMAQIEQGWQAHESVGPKLYRPYFLSLLAEAYGQAGQPEAGLPVLAEAMTLVETTEARWWEAELSRLMGVLLLQLPRPNVSSAEASFQQALDVAHRQEAKALELRAAMSLARLWQQQGKRAAARALLAPIYGWFTEGFDTADLQEAKALLEALA
jgi:predicted ATPase